MFPELRAQINPARRDRHHRFTYYLLFFDLYAMFREALEASDERTLSKLFEFAQWCFQQARRAPDLNNAVCVCFYEHVFDVARRDWPDVARRLSPSVIRACRTLWEARHSEEEMGRLRKILSAVARDS